VPNLQPLEADVGTLTTVGRTIDRNLSNVDEILQNGNNLFHGAQRAYDPNYNWLNLNLQTAPGVTGAYLAGLLRDRLAGICRRLAANHTNGLSAAVLGTLAECGNPSSSFFDSLVNDIPTIINTLTGQSPSTTAQSLLQQGLQQIQNATQNAGAGSTTPAAGSNAPKSSSPPAPTTTAPTTTTTTTQPCNLLTQLLGCKPGSGSSPSSSGSGTSSKSGSSGGGLGGLLSNKVTAARNAAVATATPATPSSNQAPSLTAPAAGLLPPLPQDQGQGHHGHHPSPGLLSQWAHDIASWF
jgi:hypothetical protein